MNAEDIKNFVFTKSAVGGYKIADVKGCLREISDYVLSLEEKNFNLDRENKSLKNKISEIEKTQEEITEIVISAQDLKRKILKETDEKQNELITKAQQNAKSIVEEAQQQSSQLLMELNKQIDLKKIQLDSLKKEVSDFKVKLLEIYKSHLDLITKLPDLKPNELNSQQDKNENFDLVNNVNESNSNMISDKVNFDDEIIEKTKNFETSNLNKIKFNLSNSDEIFKKTKKNKLTSNSVKEFVNSNFVKNTVDGAGYIKSRFEELNQS